MAVEILARDLAKPLRELSGGDVAYDVHLGASSSVLAGRDDVDDLVAVARVLNPAGPVPSTCTSGTSATTVQTCRPGLPDLSAEPFLPTPTDKRSSVRGV